MNTNWEMCHKIDTCHNFSISYFVSWISTPILHGFHSFSFEPLQMGWIKIDINLGISGANRAQLVSPVWTNIMLKYSVYWKDKLLLMLLTLHFNWISFIFRNWVKCSWIWMQFENSKRKKIVAIWKCSLSTFK